MELSADVFMTELQLAVRIRGFLICKYIVRMSSFFGCKIVFLFVTRWMHCLLASIDGCAVI